MKKVASIVLVLAFLLGVMQIAAFAQGSVNDPVPTCCDSKVHVYIPDELSPEVRAKILAYMFGEEDSEPEQDRNILCTLFGHNYETTISYTVTHNVYTTSPKCVKKTYTTYTCSRCGHVETELTKTERISTCHG